MENFPEKRLNLAIKRTAWCSPSNPSISGIFLKFPNFLWNVLKLIFPNFLPKNNKIGLLGGRLGNRHQIKAFQEFFWHFVIFCKMFYSWFLSIFYQETSKICAFCGLLGTRHQIQTFYEFSWNFLISCGMSWSWFFPIF